MLKWCLKEAPSELSWPFALRGKKTMDSSCSYRTEMVFKDHTELRVFADQDDF
jgi:hypothetical protein